MIWKCRNVRKRDSWCHHSLPKCPPQKADFLNIKIILRISIVGSDVHWTVLELTTQLFHPARGRDCRSRRIDSPALRGLQQNYLMYTELCATQWPLPSRCGCFAAQRLFGVRRRREAAPPVGPFVDRAEQQQQRREHRDAVPTPSQPHATGHVLCVSWRAPATAMAPARRAPIEGLAAAVGRRGLRCRLPNIG